MTERTEEERQAAVRETLRVIRESQERIKAMLNDIGWTGTMQRTIQEDADSASDIVRTALDEAKAKAAIQSPSRLFANGVGNAIGMACRGDAAMDDWDTRHMRSRWQRLRARLADWIAP